MQICMQETLGKREGLHCTVSVRSQLWPRLLLWYCDMVVRLQRRFSVRHFMVFGNLESRAQRRKWRPQTQHRTACVTNSQLRPPPDLVSHSCRFLEGLLLPAEGLVEAPPNQWRPFTVLLLNLDARHKIPESWNIGGGSNPFVVGKKSHDHDSSHAEYGWNLCQTSDTPLTSLQ